MSALVVDHDEYGRPVSDRYKRLGAGSAPDDDTGLYVRFEPGFGLNVHIGIRHSVYTGDYGRCPQETRDFEKVVLGIQGWERLCELVDEWRARAQ